MSVISARQQANAILVRFEVRCDSFSRSSSESCSSSSHPVKLIQSSWPISQISQVRQISQISQVSQEEVEVVDVVVNGLSG